MRSAITRPDANALRRGKRALATALLSIGAALAANATPAQGYMLKLRPLQHHTANWLIVAADERSDPNTATQDKVLPSMLRERRWWVLFDGSGQARCTLARGDRAMPATIEAARLALLRGCRNAPQALRAAAGWSDVLEARSLQFNVTWSPKQLCADGRCTAARAPQRTVFNRAALSSGKTVSRAAHALCVAGRWLVVRNLQPMDGSNEIEGAVFAGLPPATPPQIAGHEFSAIDGVAAVPAGWTCP
jgi:hypothetical protein